MKTRKFLFLAGVVAIVALLAATHAFAAPPTQCTTTNFIVNVQMQTSNGFTSYTYTMSSPTGKNPAKWFIYVKGRQVDGQGLQDDLVGSIVNTTTTGAYVLNGQFNANLPPSDGWKYIKQLDGYVFPSVAIDKILNLTVSERFRPEEGTTTVLLGLNNSVEVCGPILGPTTPAAPEFQGSPLVTTTSHQTFANGCSYFVTAGLRDNIITSMTADPATPFETVCGPSGCQACKVTVSPNICETDLGLAFCPPAELGRPPLQSVFGGTCYYPSNLKYTC